MGTAFDKVMGNRKILEDTIFDSIREKQSLFSYDTINGVLSLPVNAAQNHTYNGVNAIRLMQKAMERGLSDNRWLTFEQAKKLGYHVKPGSSGVFCEQWNFDDKTSGATGMPKVSYYYVFNAADIAGMEPKEPEVSAVSEEYKSIVERKVKDRIALLEDDGLLVNLINVFVKTKYGLLTSDYKDSEMHELSYIMKNVAKEPNYIPATIKKAQDESNIISLLIDEALLTMVQNNESVPIVDDIPEEIYESEEEEPEEDIIEEFSERYEVTETSDAFETPYAVWDNVTQDYYVEDSWIPTFETKEEAAELCSKLNAAVEQNKEVTEAPASAVTVMPDVAVTTENEAKEEPKNNDVSVVAEENGNYVFSFTEEPEVPMEIEMEPDEPEPADRKKKTTKSKQKIEDFGKKIGGARKDMWASRGLTLSDLDGMNASEMEKYITKDNVWKKPDYEKLIADGLPVKVAWFIKSVRDKVPTKPNYSSYHSAEEQAAIREEYISFVSAIRDEVMACKTKEEAVGLCQSFFHDKGYVKRNGYYLDPTEKCEHHMDNKLYTVFRDANYNWGYAYDRQIKKHQFGVDADKKLPKGYAIKEYTSGTFSVVKGNTLLQGNFDSWDAAKKYIEEIVKPTSRKKAFTPPQLEHIERVGLTDIRNDTNITGDDFLADYGFYGGEFGNWMSETDRQASLNMGYEAFYDLAEALQIANSDISFNGKLSIAFGARGHGKAAAHYEPLREVINLTKMTGAGSLAHEWGHALDDYLGKKLGYGKMLSEAMANEIAEVMDAMKYRPATEEEKAEKYDTFLVDRTATLSKNIAEAIVQYQDAVDDAKQLELSEETQARYAETSDKLEKLLASFSEKLVLKDYESCRELITQAIEWVRESNLYKNTLTVLRNASSTIDFIINWNKKRENYKVETEYYQNSKQMDGITAKCDKGYWSSSCEMFARAFACYVADKLKPGRSDYLCGHSDTAAAPGDGKMILAFPVGKDRTRINAAMDNLIRQMKEKELLTERAGMVRNRKI